MPRSFPCLTRESITTFYKPNNDFFTFFYKTFRTGSYTNKEGQKVFTTEVVVEEHEFVESKRDSQNQAPAYNTQSANAEGFMNIPEGIDNDLPFKK